MMKKLLGKMALLALTVMLFASCEKDDGVADDTGTVSFNAVLIAMVNNMNRQEVTDLPDCSAADPAYVDIVATGPMNIGSIAAPYRVDLEASGETYVTADDEELTNVPAGDYQLTYFVVYDAENNPIWIAPTSGNYEDFVEEPLPLDFTVVSGEDNEVSVDVLCFENRILNEFGSLFFSLDPHMAIEFCIVGNTCGAGDASFSTTVYSGSDDSGSLLYMDMENAPGEALCMALPDLDGEDQYYFEISMDGAVIRSGMITDADVKALHDGETNIDPYVFYEGDGCTSADSPDLFSEGGGDTGSGGGTAIDYAETFESGSSLADLMYTTVELPGQTVANGGSWQTHNKADSYASLDPFYNNPEDPDNADDSDWGVQYRYKYKPDDGTSTGTVDNVMITKEFETTGGDYNFSYDISFANPGNNTGTITVYYSDSYSGSGFNESEWTMVETVQAADIENGRTLWERMVNSISPSGNFNLAFRITDEIGDGETANDVTQWRIDNIQVSGGTIDGGSGGGDTGSTSDDAISYFESFESATSDDNVETFNYSVEVLSGTTVAAPESTTFSLTGNDKFADQDDVTASSTWGLQGGYVNKGDAETSSGEVDNVVVSPLFETSTGGSYELTYDVAEAANSAESTLKVYYSDNSTGSFSDGDWTLLTTLTKDNAGPGRNEFGRKMESLTVSGDFYVAFRLEATIGGPDDSNNAARWRLDNIRVENP